MARKAKKTKKSKKLSIIIVSILLTLIIAIIIFLVWFLNRNNVPKKYLGTWVSHMYMLNNGVETNKTFSINISKNKIEMDSTTFDIEYELEDNNFILVYINPTTKEKHKQYVLIKDDQLYLSEDKKIDDLDLCYYKQGTKAEKENILQAKADYYSNNIESLANEIIHDLYKTDDSVHYMNINELTEEQKNKKDNLNYYYAFYNSLDNTLEIAINRETGKLVYAEYIENLSSYNTSDKAASKVAASLYGICCLFYADSKDVNNINQLEETEKNVAELYGMQTVSTVLKKITEGSYISTFDDDIVKVTFSRPVYEKSGEIKIFVSTNQR